MAGNFIPTGNFVARGSHRVNPQLVEILRMAAAQMPEYRVEAYSGFRPGDRRQHGRGSAVDLRLIDKSGRTLPNYQDAKAFREYERFAQAARRVQMEKYPQLADRFRWGGYFSGGRGRYGANDAMHFDMGGGRGLGMAGGSWEQGLTAAQRRLFPGIISYGMADPRAAAATQARLAMLPSPDSPNLPSRFDFANARNAAPPMGPPRTINDYPVAEVQDSGSSILPHPDAPAERPDRFRGLGSALASVGQTIAASNAARAQIQAQADADWQAQYERSRGAPMEMLLNEMPAEIAGAVPIGDAQTPELADPANPTAAGIQSSDEILAALFGRPVGMGQRQTPFGPAYG
jgi:hypothetical protein